MRINVDPDGPRFIDVSINPVPEGMQSGYLTTPDRVRLRYAYWRRMYGPQRGTICLVHGRTEYIEKYFETIVDLRKRGFAVATFDWRGQGGSDRLIAKRRLGYVRHFKDYQTDLESFYREILFPGCPAPYYLVGHSMGGLVGLRTIAKDWSMFDRVFLSAPMLSLDGLPLSLDKMAGLSMALCFLGLGRFPIARKVDQPPSEANFPANPVTGDMNRYLRSAEVVRAGPDLEITAPTIRWIASVMRAMAEVARGDFPARIKTPLLMLAAACDAVVSSMAIERLGLRLRTGRHLMIPGARHELFMETDMIRGQVFAAFDAFITEQSG